MAKLKTTPYIESIERAKFFQSVQVSPLNDKLNYDGWLNNFDKGNDRDIACLILDFFMYYPEGMIDQMLEKSIGNTGTALSKKFVDWKHEDFKERCFYSFIPGEQPNPTDSGPIYTRKLRDKLGIPEARIKYYNELPELLEALGEPTPVILVDDFVGSGAQCDKAWNHNVFEKGQTLSLISATQGHVFAYAPLIINEQGYIRLTNNCPDLILSPAHILNLEYNLFSPECSCWQGDLDLFKAGVELIMRKSNELGIPSTGGKSTKDVMGFGKQGLALAFENGAPDAIPPLFYWSQNWTPLIPKQYSR